MSLWKDIKGTILPFWVTLRYLFRRPVTVCYPERKQTPAPRYRGRLVLTRDPDGEERCVACHLCSAACPVDCISMQAAEREDGRRYAAWFRINFSRCIFCGLCTEACPTLALQMTSEYELATRELLQVIYEKDELLIDGCGKNSEYNFYRRAGIGVAAPRGANPGESSPEDMKSNLP